MNVRTKAFWLQVREEYNPDESKYICATSPTFKGMWMCNKKEVQELAAIYLTNKQLDTLYLVGDSFLFLGCGWVASIKLRLYFIDWCIKKFD